MFQWADFRLKQMFQDETYELLPGSLGGSFEKATRKKIRISKYLLLLIHQILLISPELLKLRTTVEDIKDSMFIFLWWCIVLQRKLPKAHKSQNLNHRKYGILPASALYPPDEIYEIYVLIDDNLQLNVSIAMLLLQKHMVDLSFIIFILGSFYYFMYLFFLKYNPVEHICNVMWTSILIPYSRSAQNDPSSLNIISSSPFINLHQCPQRKLVVLKCN